jgi:hypothetical protein
MKVLTHDFNIDAVYLLINVVIPIGGSLLAEHLQATASGATAVPVAGH